MLMIVMRVVSPGWAGLEWQTGLVCGDAEGYQLWDPTTPFGVISASSAVQYF